MYFVSAKLRRNIISAKQFLSNPHVTKRAVPPNIGTALGYYLVASYSSFLIDKLKLSTFYCKPVWAIVSHKVVKLELVRVSWYYYSTFAVFIPEVAFGIVGLDAFEYIADIA